MDDAAVIEFQRGLQQQVTEYWKNAEVERNLHHKNAELLYLSMQMKNRSWTIGLAFVLV